MPPGIGAAGCVGVAFEVTPGTYVAPTKFIPITGESLMVDKQINFTRPIIKDSVEPVHAVTGPEFVTGDIEMEVITDGLVYFLFASRNSIVKGGVGPYTYTFSPTSAASVADGKTLSITVVRNDVVFGYTGCVMSGMTLGVNNGMMVATINILGSGEATQAAPVATFPTTVPFGADAYTIEIPTASAISDAGSFEFNLDDSGEPQYRLGSLAAQFIKLGERNVSMSIERDFLNKTEYDIFRAVTAQELHVRAEQPTNAAEYVDILLRSGIMESYEAFLESQGEIITAALEYTGKWDFTATESYQIEVGTTENLTP